MSETSQSTTEKIKILLVEDHTVTRLGLKFILGSYPNIDLIGEAVNGADALKQLEKMQPDVVIMDVEMPVMDGIEAARLCRQAYPDLKIVMLTAHRHEKDVFAALAAGANGYCIKDITDARLIKAIESVRDGDFWLDSTIAAKVVKALPEPSTNNGKASTDQLSERELEVLNLIVEGLSNQQISTRLYISHDTVKSHIKHILEKLAVTDRTQAAVKAIRQGLV